MKERVKPFNSGGVMEGKKSHIWTTKTGEKIPIKKMTDEHLGRTLLILSNAGHKHWIAMMNRDFKRYGCSLTKPEEAYHPQWDLLLKEFNRRKLKVITNNGKFVRVEKIQENPHDRL